MVLYTMILVELQSLQMLPCTITDDSPDVTVSSGICLTTDTLDCTKCNGTQKAQIVCLAWSFIYAMVRLCCQSDFTAKGIVSVLT